MSCFASYVVQKMSHFTFGKDSSPSSHRKGTPKNASRDKWRERTVTTLGRPMCASSEVFEIHVCKILKKEPSGPMVGSGTNIFSSHGPHLHGFGHTIKGGLLTNFFIVLHEQENLKEHRDFGRAVVVPCPCPWQTSIMAGHWYWLHFWPQPVFVAVNYFLFAWLCCAMVDADSSLSLTARLPVTSKPVLE